MILLLDIGPWVALMCKNDRYHQWSRDQFAVHRGPFLTCEAVVAETCFFISRGGFDPAKALMFIERGAVQMAIDLQAEVAPVRALFERYENVPASLADACLIRLSELHVASRVLTIDRDFRIYRRRGRQALDLVIPDA